MAFIGKVYKHVKDENFDGFIDSLGIPAERAEYFKNLKPTQEVKKVGDTYTMSMNNVEMKFKSGIEFITPAPGALGTIKNLITVDGDTITQVEEFDDGRIITSKREFSGDKIIVTITNSFWDGTAIRYYAAD